MRTCLPESKPKGAWTASPSARGTTFWPCQNARASRRPAPAARGPSELPPSSPVPRLVNGGRALPPAGRLGRERIATGPSGQGALARVRQPAHLRCVRDRLAPPLALVQLCVLASGAGLQPRANLRLHSCGGNCGPNSQPFTYLARSRQVFTPGCSLCLFSGQGANC